MDYSLITVGGISTIVIFYLSLIFAILATKEALYDDDQTEKTSKNKVKWLFRMFHFILNGITIFMAITTIMQGFGYQMMNGCALIFMTTIHITISLIAVLLHILWLRMVVTHSHIPDNEDKPLRLVKILLVCGI